MISHGDWNEIQSLIRRMIGDQGDTFVQGTVIRNDPIRKVVFVKEFGDIPIPIVAHWYQVTYNTRDTSGRVLRTKTIPYSTDVDVLVPRVGDIVFIAQHLGTRSLPKCLGVIQSKNFVTGD